MSSNQINYVDIQSYYEKKTIKTLNLNDYIRLLKEQADHDGKIINKIQLQLL